MGAVNLPDNIQDGEDLLAAPVMANFQAITQGVNGNLEAGSNISTASAVTQPGSANAEGVAATLVRSDHKHLIQGFENLAADPTTGNFKGRVYWNTVSSELRYCADATGSGTFGAITPTATELVVHAAQHKDGGHDPLADNTLTDHMFAAKTNLYASTISADVSTISGSGYTTIIDNFAVTTTGSQTLAFTINLRFKNNTPNPRTVGYRVVDVTASATTIFASNRETMAVSGGADQSVFPATFFYTTPSGGARQFRLGAGADSAAGGGVDVVKGTSFNSETLVPVTMQAVIL